jgi:hypothetical protein
MNAHPLFQTGLQAGRTWRNNPTAHTFDTLPYCCQPIDEAQRFKREFAFAVQADPAVDAEAAFPAFL